MKIISYIGMAFVLSSLLMMIFGHMGEHELSWRSAQISSYAARAPYDYFISLAIYFSAISIIIVSILISRYQLVGTAVLIHIIPILLGGATVGLLMLASYEETASTISLLKQTSFWDIRIQSFHDAGLEVFFYSMLLAVVVIGIMMVLSRSRSTVKVIGGLVILAGPASYLLMTTHWPKLLGIEDVTIGINQRASLFILWLSMALILYVSILKSDVEITNEQ